MDKLLQLDQEWFLRLNNMGSVAYDDYWILISDKWTWIPFYVCILVLLKMYFNWKEFFVIVGCLIFGIAVSDQLANLIKETVQRLRPCHEPSIHGQFRELDGGELYGFYSAHASNSFLIVVFLVKVLVDKANWFHFVLAIWAVAVSYSRIYLGVHYPGDLIVGAVVGGIIATQIYQIYSLGVQMINKEEESE